jgi:iron complex outermembrane receptor protein
MREELIDRILVATLVAIALCIAAPVAAQSADEESAGEVAEAAAEPTEEDLIEEAMKREFAGEIVVTSRRRAEKLQEVPVAVSVVTSDQLEDLVATDISELQQFVPNLSIYQGRNQSTTLTAFIRGVGQADPLWGVDPGVGLYIDDVYIARAQGALLDVYDVERVEVLRGPQGTLYGKNTIGGAVKYVTRGLSDNPEGKVTWNPGSFGQQELRATIAGPLVKGKLRGKASAAWLTRDGYGTNHYTGREVSNKDTKAWRLGLQWLPTDNLSLQLNYDHTQDDAEPLGYKRLQANPLCPIFLGSTCEPFDNNFDTESGLEPINSTKMDGYSLALIWDINEALQFKSITARRETDTENNIDFDTTPAPIVDSSPVYFDDQTTQEFQLLYTGSDRWNGVLGFYYFDGNAGGVVNATFVGSTFTTTSGEVGTKSYAIYADANVKLADKLTLNLGIRPTRETKHGQAFNVLNTDATYDDILLVLADFDDKVTFTSWAPKIGLEYQFNPDVMGYIKVNRGFKSGGYNVRAQSEFFPDSALPFDDEVMTVAELGAKTVLANRSLVLNAAVFYGDYTDIQVSTFTSYDSDGDGEDDAFFGNFLNAGDATVKGVEVEYNWSSRSFFGLQGFIAYLDAKPDTFLDENEDGFVDTQVITNAPEWTGTIRANFDWPLAGGLLTASVGYAYRDDSMLTNEGGADPRDPTGETPLEPLIQESYGLLDAWVAWLSPNAHWRLGISGKNLTDEDYLLTGYNLPVFGVVTGSYGAPRTIVGTVEYRFW